MTMELRYNKEKGGKLVAVGDIITDRYYRNGKPNNDLKIISWDCTSLAIKTLPDYYWHKSPKEWVCYKYHQACDLGMEWTGGTIRDQFVQAIQHNVLNSIPDADDFDWGDESYEEAKQHPRTFLQGLESTHIGVEGVMADVQRASVVALDTMIKQLSNPATELWDGLPRRLMQWMDMEPKTPRALFKHLERTGTPAPAWLREETEMNQLDHVPSKGTRTVLILRAFLEGLKEKQDG